MMELSDNHGFSAGDTIAIELPTSGYAIGVIGRLAAERMLVTTCQPSISVLPPNPETADWKPTGWSTWIADTVGLSDGSWIAIDPPPGLSLAAHVDVRHLPHFKASAGRGKPKLAAYDPETLFVNRIIDSPDAAEYAAAPALVPQDATTFEIAVSKNVGQECELPDKATIDRLNKSRVVIAMLREHVSSGVYELVFDHTLSFRKSNDAAKAYTELQSRGLDVERLRRKGLFGPHEVRVRARSPLAWPAMREVIRRMERLAQGFGGRYDGFGAQPV